MMIYDNPKQGDTITVEKNPLSEWYSVTINGVEQPPVCREDVLNGTVTERIALAIGSLWKSHRPRT